jgi:hypothetical protein
VPSTTSTERDFSTKIQVLAAAFSLAASTAAAAPPEGCFARAYDAAHLAAHPDQVVASMTLSFDYDPSADFATVPPGGFGASLTVILANQGHVTGERAPDEGYPDGFGGAHMDNVLLCEEHGGIIRCGVACDSGGFEVTRYDGRELAIRTDYLMVGMGQDCGGFTDLAEHQGQPVTFLLTRAPAALCNAE